MPSVKTLDYFVSNVGQPSWWRGIFKHAKHFYIFYVFLAVLWIWSSITVTFFLNALIFRWLQNGLAQLPFYWMLFQLPSPLQRQLLQHHKMPGRLRPFSIFLLPKTGRYAWRVVLGGIESLCNTSAKVQRMNPVIMYIWTVLFYCTLLHPVVALGLCTIFVQRSNKGVSSAV